MMTATTKTFNIAGSHSGNVIIEDPDLRARFAKRMGGLGISPNSFGLIWQRQPIHLKARSGWMN